MKVSYKKRTNGKQTKAEYYQMLLDQMRKKYNDPYIKSGLWMLSDRVQWILLGILVVFLAMLAYLLYSYGL